MSEQTASTLDFELDGESVQEENSTVQRCLSFQVDDLVLFLSTDYIVEIVNDYPITPLPMVPSFVKGMINLRGQILPVLDMRMCMDKSPAEYTSKTCIIRLNIDSVPLCIVVDTVCQVLDIDMQYVRPIPVKRQQKLLNGMIDLGNGNVIMSFDCNVLLERRF
ncbi:MAG: chemotaxis protein CheW [Lachnospiraceae bacterium]|jgi:purine-binding chemotaxis protein CheW|nr:chemotaxis protein CheW [Lachnospiraceae bacterium]